ncbi:NACHT domain-containing NTPase [Streptomyces atratus]|uniref:NACHT domain-containing protein n=1 Tax=Streptomyces atratus TaxID=1893 RepID=UPI0021A9302C|nr:NACHT domain-containing protein [Streptomyces atratus]MCT2546283.1 NACHT domain-containing protein [Streptomyces atratus]
MEPTTIGARLASAAIGPLIKKLFVSEGPGAGLVDKPVRISAYVSFKGEKRTLTDADVGRLADRLVRQALRAGEQPVAADEQQAVTDALAVTLRALGDITVTDLDAVRLGHNEFARSLRRASGSPERHLSADGTYFYESLLDTACLHILHFFTQRSTFVAHALVEQARSLGELVAKLDELIRRNPLPGSEDAAFEQRYLAYVAKKHGKLTIYGLDLNNSPRRWPLDVAYLSLHASPSWNRVVLDQLLGGAAATADERAAVLLSASSVLPATDDGGRDALVTSAFVEELWSLREKTRILQAHEPVDPGEAGLHLRKLSRALNSLHSGLFTPQPADRALATSHRVLLRGEAGSGKTTLVQWLAVTAARQDLPDGADYLYDRVPFVLPLRTLTRNGRDLPSPKRFLAATSCPLDGSQPDGWEHRVLLAGRGLLLIDGIDEIPDRERERARRWLRDLADTYDSDNRWLITSRPAAVDRDWLAEENFTELSLAAMDSASIATFIRRWHHAARVGNEDDTDLERYEAQLLTAVRTEPGLARLATNPLMCGLICALHRDRRGYLPHGRKDLYEAALSMLLSRRDRERDMEGPELADDPQLDVLQRLAYWLIKNGRTEMDRARAESIIGRALPTVPEVAALGDASAVFDHFLQRSGLLREPSLDSVDFIHRTFQDFLGARAALEEGDFGLLSEHAANDQWEDVIRMAVALARARERATIFEALLAQGDQAVEQRVQTRIYLLAAACLEHATALDPAIREAVEQRTATLVPPGSEAEAKALAEVGPLILHLLPGPDELDDVAAFNVVIAASHIKSDAAVAFLSRFADHSFIPVRLHLLWAWSRFDTARYAEEVVARLDLTGLSCTIQSDEQLRQLIRLRVRPDDLDIRTGVSLKALAMYSAEQPFASLSVSSNEITELKFLTGQTRLRSLIINNCPHLTDLSALTGLPIRYLDISTTRSDLDLRPLSQLPELATLTLTGPADLRWSLADLPRSTPLHVLKVAGSMRPEGGVRGIGDFPEMKTLTLNSPSCPTSAEEWAEIRSLSRLTELVTTAVSLETLPSDAVLGGISHLALSGGDGDRVVQAAVRRLPHAFPGLVTCELSGDMTAEGDIDVTPLARLTCLRDVIITIAQDRVQGLDALDDSLTVNLLA